MVAGLNISVCPVLVPETVAALRRLLCGINKINDNTGGFKCQTFSVVFSKGRMILWSLGHAFLSIEAKKKKKAKRKGSSEVHASSIELGRTYLYEERGGLWEC